VAQGVNFAVPINTVKSVVEQLIDTGEVEHGYIGVSMFPLGIEDLAVYSGQSLEDFSAQYGLPQNGAIISKTVEGGPAEEAGLKGGDDDQEEIAGVEVPLGDVITEVEGESVATSEDVIEVVNALKPDDTVTLTVATPGQEPREVRVELGVQPPGQQQQQPRQQPQQ
jgi:S1-C subfamily serine protease